MKPIWYLLERPFLIMRNISLYSQMYHCNITEHATGCLNFFVFHNVSLKLIPLSVLIIFVALCTVCSNSSVNFCCLKTCTLYRAGNVLILNLMASLWSWLFVNVLRQSANFFVKILAAMLVRKRFFEFKCASDFEG